MIFKICILLVLCACFSPSLTALCKDRKSCCSVNFQHDLCKYEGSETCYCDDQCLMRGDCCSDFRDFCLDGQPEPCIYSLWESWSSCSTVADCDVGFRTRQRHVLQTGTQKSIVRCEQSELQETEKCGDLHCHNFFIDRISNMEEYKSEHFDYTTAVYQFVRNKMGNCNDFESNDLNVCILCTDESRCGNKMIKEDEELDIWYKQCHGTWRKVTRSFYKKTCYNILPFVKHYSFELTK